MKDNSNLNETNLQDVQDVQTNANGADKKDKKDKKKNKLTTILMLAIIALLIALLCRSCGTEKVVNKADYENNDMYAQIDQISDMTEEDKMAEIEKLVKESEINITYFNECSFKKDENGVLVSEHFLVRNIPNNHHNIDFTIYDEGGDVVYHSMEIPTGSEIKVISLKQDIAPGTYEWKIQIGYVNYGNVYSTLPLTVTVE